ncbi:hypothetical protein Nepgr_033777 [Nepenthes gracilis]|uniref:Disease resistance protein At4g27190-like leucine-rich repeats domain-containing protein n=1 Tax=Nepenthes gracilis TaxID=150966 RepID=A0AAD3Y770_NEPGR|nr:hypothetical protein Nepgr_033777 [Nepenthes gracilis]
MRSIWMSNDVIIHHIFQNLKNLTIKGCPNLEILCPFSVAAILDQLETLNVESNENMKEIIAKETGEMKNDDTEMTILPKLRNIELQSLSNLKCFFGGSIKLIFPSLKSINCKDLNEMVAFVSPEDSGALFSDKVKFPGLEELRISNVGGIKELWNLSYVEEEVPTFPRLVHLEVDSLPKMRSIWMSNDIIIHHIFQNLKNLTVKRCPNLEILCPLSVVAVLKQLETLKVKQNENMKEIIAKEVGGMKTNDIEMTILPKLRNIELQSLSNFKCFFGGSIKLIFPSLKSINCNDLNKMVAFVSPEDSGALFNDKVKFPGLEELRISNVCGIKELWNLSDVEEEVPTFPRLVHLTVDRLPEMRSIWMSNDVIIHHIFQNLKNLTVTQCPKLEILCPFSVAATFEQLETLNVQENENMKEIIAKETGETKNNSTEMIIFPKLQNMKLEMLPDLKCFFGGSIKLVFPSLEIINFSNLGKMVTFVSTEYPRNSDALFNDKVALPTIKKIYMHHVNGPKEIWGSHLDAGSFNKLESLTVSNVEKDTKVFH